MSETLTIGVYQLANLLRNRVPFLYFDLSSDRGMDVAKGHPLLFGSERIDGAKILELANERGLQPSQPIVLICENGSKSVEAARVLEQNSFINVFVVEGGKKSLEGGS